MGTMTAKYNGKCQECGGNIRAGEQIHYSPASKARHLDCASGGRPTKATEKSTKSQPRKPSYPDGPPEPGAHEISGRAESPYDRYHVGQVLYAPKVKVPGGGPDGHYYTVLAETYVPSNEDFGDYDASRHAWVRASSEQEAAPVAAKRRTAENPKVVLAYVVAAVKAGEAIPEEGARDSIPRGAPHWSSGQKGDLHVVATLPDGSVVGYHGGFYDDYRASAWRVSSPSPTLLLAVRALISGDSQELAVAADAVRS